VKSDSVTENNRRSDQSDENCDDHEEYRDVFDNDGATLLPYFDVEDGCMYLL